jgi:TolB protein
MFVVLAALVLAAAVVPASQATFPGANGHIVYQATVGDHVQLFTVSPDGSGVRQLTHFTDSDGVAGSWSPTARQIVFERDFPDSTQIEVMNADGSDVRPLTHGELDFTPAYSPNGNEIVFERARADGDGVWIMNANGGGLRQITNNPPPASGCE